MTTSPPIVSAAQFEAAFRLEPNPWPNSATNRALVQLGLPSPTGLTLWLAPERGGRLEPRVSLPQHPQVVPRFVSAGSTGPQRVELSGLTPATTYAIDVATTASGPTQHLRATTAPATTDAGNFSFLATSCFAPYDHQQGLVGTLFHKLSRRFGKRTRRQPHIMRRTAHVLRLLLQRASAPAPQKPAFWLGLGDQIYVDTGESTGQAMLTGKNADEKLYAPAELPQLFETLYRAYFSLEPYASALQALPTAMIWDDHEIRDGWGSHDDEENAAAWGQHLQVARDYFVGWQASRNPPAAGAIATTESYAEAARVGPYLTKNSEFDFSFDWGSQATFFIMDLRSQRDTLRGQAGSDAQLERLKAWFASRDDSPTLWVLGSPLPLSQSMSFFDGVQLHIGQRKDDMRDAWWSDALTKQREAILQTIVEHFRAHRSHRLLILSGDVHFSELLELSDEEDRDRVYGHEIVSSGLAQSYFTFLRRKSQTKTKLCCGLSARGLGRIHGPCFAEIFVQPQVDAAPGVEVTFHASVDSSGKHLANLGAPSQKRLRLPLETLSSDDRKHWLFEYFTDDADAHTDATALEPAPDAGASS